ncbi:MAG: hypothetical protein CL862_00460 [Cyanobium sp. NAT70]|nr:hypothetical protein [Cyanobium sp. NAT70]|tara:strand:+ start:841 stop:3057 length:2217 start_codon:yes stop_codon:yes gene_type:complete
MADASIKATAATFGNKLRLHLKENMAGYFFFFFGVLFAVAITIFFQKMDDDNMEDFKRFIAGSGAISLGTVMLLPDLARLFYFLKTNQKKFKDEALFNGPMIVLKILYIYFLAERVSHLGDFDLKAKEEELRDQINAKDDGAKEKLEDIKRLRKKYDTAQMAMLSALVVMPIAMTLTRMSSSRWRRLAVERQKKKDDENLFQTQVQVEKNEEGGYTIKFPDSNNERRTFDCDNGNCSGLERLVIDGDPKETYLDTGVTRAKAHDLIMEMVQKKAREQRKDAADEVAGEEERAEMIQQTERRKRKAERDVELVNTSQALADTEEETAAKERWIAEQQANTAKLLAEREVEDQKERIRREVKKEQDKKELMERKLEALEECDEFEDEDKFIKCMRENTLVPESVTVRKYLKQVKDLDADGKRKYRNQVIAQARQPFDDVEKSEAAKVQNDALSKEQKEAKKKLDACLKLKVNEPRQFVKCVAGKKLIDEKAQNSYVTQLNDNDKKDKKDGDKKEGEDFAKALRERIESTIRLKHSLQAEASASPKESEGASSAPPAVSKPKSEPEKEQPKETKGGAKEGEATPPKEEKSTTSPKQEKSATSQEKSATSPERAESVSSSAIPPENASDESKVSGSESSEKASTKKDTNAAEQCVKTNKTKPWGQLFDCLTGTKDMSVTYTEQQKLKEEMKITDDSNIKNFIEEQVKKKRFENSKSFEEFKEAVRNKEGEFQQKYSKDLKSS